MQRPTVHDIAKVAGVSLATVDRVLNDRPGVREQTILRVHQAISSLGYVRDVAAANLARGRNYSLAFVLPEGRTAFLAAMRAEIDAVAQRAATDRCSVRFLAVPAFDGDAFARAMDALDGVDGVAIMAPETPQVRDAVNRLKQRKIAVAALVSDLPGSARDHFIGVDNVAAGRTAAVLIGRFLGATPAARQASVAPTRTGKVLVLAGSMLARGHAERRLGFDTVMAQHFPALTVLPSVEGRDDADRIARLLPQVLDRSPDICGIYSLGAGNSGLIRVLEDLNPSRRITVIAHELTAPARAALKRGTFDAVIAQDVGHIIRSAGRVLRAISDGIDIVAAQERIRIEIYLAENLP